MNQPYSRYKNRLSQQCEQRGMALSGLQLDRLTQYVALLQQWRQAMNLTGLRDAERMIDVLVAESLDFLWREALPPTARVLDLGTGAGVPGIPLAICAPDLTLTLLDRSQKKITFLRHIVPQLQLHNCHPVCATAEALTQHLAASQRFDAVVTRGVGTVAHLLSLAGPLLRPGGALLLRKPAQTPELQEAEGLLTAGYWADLKTRPLLPGGGTAWVLLVAYRAATVCAADAGALETDDGLQLER
jgi:16S rRNA (guanine527-N7)-methyltransferase